jgi:hypothetical protein
LARCLAWSKGQLLAKCDAALTQEAALVVMGVEQRQLLMAVHDIRECRRQVGGRSWRRATITRIGRAASRKPGAFSHRETVA